MTIGLAVGVAVLYRGLRHRRGGKENTSAERFPGLFTYAVWVEWEILVTTIPKIFVRDGLPDDAMTG